VLDTVTLGDGVVEPDLVPVGEPELEREEDGDLLGVGLADPDRDGLVEGVLDTVTLGDEDVEPDLDPVEEPELERDGVGEVV
jgi:hypothetical protein